MIYVCILCILWIHCYTLDIYTYVCHTIPSVSSIECCVLLVVTSDFRQRSPAAALRQQQKLCGCPFSLRKPNMILKFPCVFRYSMWSACEGFPGFGVRFPALKFGSATLRLRQPPWPPADARLDRPCLFFSQSMSMAFVTTDIHIYIYVLNDIFVVC